MTIASPPAHDRVLDFRALFERAPGRYLVLLPDSPRFTIVAATDGYARATMTRRQVIMGQALFDVFPDNPADAGATGVANLRASLERVLAHRSPDEMAVQKYDIRRPDADGGGFEERWWSPLNVPVLGDDGEIRYIVHSVDDVTEVVKLRRREAQLRDVRDELAVARHRVHQHHLIALLFEASSDAILLCAPDGGIVAANRAATKIFVRTETEICRVGRAGLFDLTESSLGASLFGRLRHVRYVGELTGIRGDGTRFPVEVSSAVFYDVDGLIVSSMIVRDITDRKRTEEALRTARLALEKANQDLERRADERAKQLRHFAGRLEAAETRERQQIARDLHDELEQILAAILIRLDVLRASEDPAISANANTLFELAQRASTSVHSLAVQLVPPVLYELGLVPALQWLAEEMQDTFGLDVAIEDDGRTRPLSQETRAVLYRAARELVINVAKHARTDRARVRVSKTADTIAIDVIDHGVGFDWPSIEGSERQGFGLVGLRERLSYIGGGMEVRSSPGQGARVTLYAPASSSLPQ